MKIGPRIFVGLFVALAVLVEYLVFFVLMLIARGTFSICRFANCVVVLPTKPFRIVSQKIYNLSVWLWRFIIFVGNRCSMSCLMAHSILLKQLSRMSVIESIRTIVP